MIQYNKVTQGFYRRAISVGIVRCRPLPITLMLTTFVTRHYIALHLIYPKMVFLKPLARWKIIDAIYNTQNARESRCSAQEYNAMII